MKVVFKKVNVQLINITIGAEPHIENCGRIAYRSDLDGKKDTGNFIKMLIKNGHESVLEHASASFVVDCDRAIANEIVRHRIASYTQESTRYCNYTKKKFSNTIAFIEPCFEDALAISEYKQSCKNSAQSYEEMIKKGIKPEIARQTLSMGLMTKIVMTANMRTWRNFIKLRLGISGNPHPQIRQVTGLILSKLYENCPNIFADLVETQRRG